MTLILTDEDRSMAAGDAGEGVALAMRVITRLAEASGASRLIDVSSAHIDSCLYHGDAGLDFAERLAATGVMVRIPTTLNVSSLDLLHPQLFRGSDRLAERGRRLMAAYVALGGKPTWTCAPYQEAERPGFGEHIAWAESNAIVFANSVLGARTDRYGDFVDICAAITGRVPDSGLHRDEHRRARAVFTLSGTAERLVASGMLFPVVGHLVGKATGPLVPAIVGLPDATEDDLKALGAAAASSGGVALVHCVGITPEATTLADALQGDEPEVVVDVDTEALRIAYEELSTVAEGSLSAVSVGTPHASLDELARVAALLAGRSIASGVDMYVSTSRHVLARAAAAGIAATIHAAGVDIVTDTCTYITPVLRDTTGVVMTDSAKWAYYAPGNLGVDVVFAGIEDCVESAIAGEIRRDEAIWRG